MLCIIPKSCFLEIPLYFDTVQDPAEYDSDEAEMGFVMTRIYHFAVCKCVATAEKVSLERMRTAKA